MTSRNFPPHQNDGEGDHPQSGRGASRPSPEYPSTMLRMVPLPTLCVERIVQEQR
jgi:hypothetical protein